MPKCLTGGRLALWGIALVGPLFVMSNLRGEEPLGVKVPEGFKVELYADDQLAHDIYSMTIDSKGRVVVSGQGYVRILIDKDGDGKAESFKQFADGPATGAQGMYFHGPDLFCSGDSGLIRYIDENKDDRADGPPEIFLKIKTGGEHNAHAIRRGPDGWWYVIAGNTAEVNAGYATLPTSPVKNPEHGCILRLKPDLSGGEVFAHGFRNAYDFDFGALGDVFSFDSDDERDVSLPWYQPQRVFHVLSGSHQGWISKGWKRPGYFLDMPPVIGAFGRGSPTGVVCYRQSHFPENMHGALFIQDWTFGRVWALPMERAGATWKSEPIEFMTAEGDFGFAPTDVEVGPDGSLFVCIGGRGTRGSVFRVTYPGRKRVEDQKLPADVPGQLEYCLAQPDPLSSWARVRWQPVAKTLGPVPFIEALKTEERTVEQRIRAIEILTEMFKGIPADLLSKLLASTAPEIRARTLWSLQTSGPQGLTPEMILKLSKDSDQLVRRQLFECLTRHPVTTADPVLAEAFDHGLGSESRFVGQTAAHALRAVPQEMMHLIGALVRKSSWQTALMFSYAQYLRQQYLQPGINAYAIEMGRRVLEGQHPPAVKLEAVRLIQLGMGDLGLYEKLPAVTRGYTSPFDLRGLERDLDPVRVTLGQVFPSGDKLLDEELARTAAVLELLNPKFLEQILKKITAETSPTDDIHYLIVAGRMPAPRNGAARQAIAAALVNIDDKITSRKMALDTNWSDRITEMYNMLVEQDPDLPDEVIQQKNFGSPGHILLLGRTAPEKLPQALAKFAARAKANEDYAWSNDVVFLFGSIETPENRALLRSLYENMAVRNAAVISLANRPEPQDREKFVEGLDSSQLEVLTASLGALEKLPASGDAAENVMLVRTLRRLGGDKSEFPLRDRVVQLLERNTGRQYPYVPGPGGAMPQPEALKAWTDWANEAFPQQAAAGLSGGSEADLKDVKRLLAEVPWDQGNPERGRKVFESRACHQCHMGQKALGPDLAGVTGRFSREDLLTAIILPNRDVSSRYHTTMIETTGGKVYSGLIVYESVDGILMRNSTNQTFRFEANEIASRRKLSTSLMPSGLLKDTSSEQVADLVSYLQTLKPRPTPQAVNPEFQN